LKKEYVTKKKFDDLRTYDEIREHVLYVIEYENGRIRYGWSDDGKGIWVYDWYGEFKEAQEQVTV
jgi:hypothetical protein